MKLKTAFRWTAALFVIGIFSILTTFGIGMIQHILRDYDHYPEVLKQHGWPLPFYHETTFSDAGIHGGKIDNLVLDVVFFFLVYCALFGGYKLVVRSWKSSPTPGATDHELIDTTDR